MFTKKEEVKPDTEIKGVRIDGYFGPGLLRPGVGKLVQRSGEPQFCGSMAFRVFQCDESESRYTDMSGKPKISRRFSGEFLGITYDGRHINAAEGYVPSSIERSTKSRTDRGETVAFAGDLWCEPAENTPLGYVFRLYDRRPRGAADPLMQLAAAAGLIEPPALPAPQSRAEAARIDPETGEVIEPPERAEAAE